MLSALYSLHIYSSVYKNFYLGFYLVSYTNIKDFILNEKFYQTHLLSKYTYLLSVFQNYACFHLLKGKGNASIFQFVPIDHLQSFHTHTYPQHLEITDLFTLSMNLALGAVFLFVCFVRFHIKVRPHDICFSPRGSSQPRDQTQVSCIAGRFFTS